MNLNHAAKYSALLCVALIACKREAFPVNIEGCIPIMRLKINRMQKYAINSALLSRVNIGRKSFNINRFCSYEKTTSNGKFRLLTIYHSGASHVSQTWILLTKNEAIDTKLNRYYMVTDSLGTQKLIQESLNKLVDADEASRNELYQLLISEARYYRRNGDKLGSQ